MNKTDPIITVALKATNILTRRCLFCDGLTDRHAVQAEVSFPGGMGLTGAEDGDCVICLDCLRESPEERDLTLRANAEWFRARATELDAIADKPPALPTYADWQRASDTHDEQRYQDQFGCSIAEMELRRTAVHRSIQ